MSPFAALAFLALAPALAQVPGEMVDIGGYRLHLYCMGTGSPTVVLENGAGDSFAVWALVQPGVARFTRVCSYDRAYDGFSDAGPIPVTFHQQAHELHSLLQAARIPPPYVLVGHSYGGMLVRVYITLYPADVAGMVLVDAMHEENRLGNGLYRALAKGQPIPPIQSMKSSPPQPNTPLEIKMMETRARENSHLDPEDPFAHLPPQAREWDHDARTHGKTPSGARGPWEFMLAEEFQQIHDARQGHEFPFGELPMVVLGAGRTRDGNTPERRSQLQDMARLSHRARLIIDADSRHHMQCDDPQLVIQSTREVVDAAR